MTAGEWKAKAEEELPVVQDGGKSSSGKRLAYMDIARGIAMLCIIAGHFGVTTINGLVYSFHVPLFFLLSGYFFSLRGTWRDFIVTKTKQLLIPYWVGVAGIMVATTICFPLLGYGFEDVIVRLCYILKAGVLGAGTLHMEPFEIHQIGALWFLLALLFGSVALRVALETRFPILVVTAFAAAAWVSSLFIWLPFSIQPGMFASFYLYVGYVARKKRIIERFANWWIAAAALVVWVFCLQRGCSVNIVEVAVYGGLIAIVGSLSASYLVVIVSKWIYGHTNLPARFLNYYGQITLGILVFHAISDFVFPWYLLYEALALVGIVGPLSHLVVISCNVVWPLVGVALIRFVRPVYMVLVPREPQPLPELDQQ